MVAADGRERDRARLNVVLFIALVFTWGSSFLLIRIGIGMFPPLQLAAVRALLGAVTLLAVLFATGRRLPRGRSIWWHMFVVASAQCSIPFALTAWVVQYLPSGLASIDNAAAPMLTVAFTPLLLRNERFSSTQVLGLLVGVAGVVVLLAPWNLAGGGADLHLAAELAMLLSATVYAFGLVYMRRFVAGTGHEPMTVATMQMVLCAGVLLGPGLATLGAPVRFNAQAVVAVVILGALGTGIAYIWNARLIRDWGASRTSTVTYLMPLVGVVAGAVLLDESLSWNQPLGGAVILAGILVSRRSTPPANPPTAV
ncbi:DMT family transporter [Nakamurella alba]|uniref:DMT family transporter n=1 Tax=Nakamurella alba TaxID=2665158 RepID=UPI0018A8D605|nr:EamA family transporter [Nakamurella alba]